MGALVALRLVEVKAVLGKAHVLAALAFYRNAVVRLLMGEPEALHDHVRHALELKACWAVYLRAAHRPGRYDYRGACRPPQVFNEQRVGRVLVQPVFRVVLAVL